MKRKLPVIDIRATAIELYGPDGWRTKICNVLGVTRLTLWRWEKGKTAVPKAVVLALRGLLLARRYGQQEPPHLTRR